MLQAELDNGELVTLATADTTEVHGISWLVQNTHSPWIQSKCLTKIQSQSVDAASWFSSNSTTLIEITSELNGPIKDFPDRFKQLITKDASDWIKQLESDPVVSIHYEDRYLKSPWSALLLAGVFWVFKNDSLKSINITTHFKDGYGQPKWLWDNWESSDDYLQVLPKLFNAITGVSSHIDVKTVLNDVSHRRILTLNLSSGRTVKCSFDQGMGYWNAHALNLQDRKFDFEGSAKEQLQGFLGAWSNVGVTNSGSWPTHILLYEMEDE